MLKKVVLVLTVIFLLPFISSAASCPNLTRNLSFGSRGNDVTQLQQFLVSQNLLAAGNNTGYFGKLTQSAVKKFQCKNMNICSGSPSTNGYGAVGPRTRERIAQVCGTKTVPLSCTTPWGSTIQSGFSVTAYQSPTVSQGQTCQSEARICTNGTLNGSYQYASCTEQQPTNASCYLDGVTVAHGQTRTFYSLRNAPSAVSCTTYAMERTCTNGIFSGSATYQYSYCTETSAVPPVPIETSIQPASVPTKVLSAIGGNSPLIDFLISDVCVDGNDNPINGDPATCAHHRDLKFGEFVPYQRTDRSWNLFYQASMSFPTEAPDGSLLVMKSMEFGGSTPGSAFRDYDIFNPAIDGYDLHEANSPYVSAISTQDPSGYKPLWAPGCAHDDSWVLWPSSLTSGAEGHSVFQLNSGLQCPSFFVPSFTNWHYYETPITYTSGKTLDSIVSWHYNDGDTSKISAIEVFYNTKEYGGTRWDAWNTAGPAEPSGACNGVHEADFFGKHMYLIACRDWTFTTDLLVPISPLASPMGHELVFSKNQLVGGDFAQAQMDSWKRFNNGALMTDWQTSQEPVTNNYFLKVACMSGCNGNSIYQDISTADWRGKIMLRYGALLKASQSAKAVVTLFLLDANGAIVANPQTPVTVGTTWQHVDGTLEWDFSASPVRTIRYQIYINTAAAQYSIDEAYLTPSY